MCLFYLSLLLLEIMIECIVVSLQSLFEFRYTAPLARDMHCHVPLVVFAIVREITFSWIL